MRGSLFIGVAGFLVAIRAGADVVALNEQETLSGNVVRIVEGTLVFRTSLAGQLMVPMDTLQGLTTDANLVITLTNGEVIYGKFRRSPEEQQVVPINGGAATPLALADVVEALPIPSTPETPPGSAPDAVTQVGVETALQWRDTSRTSTDLVGRVDLQRETEGQSLSGHVLVGRDDSGYFPSLAEGSLEWWRGGAAGMGPFVRGDAERDTSAGLGLRAQLTLGIQDMLWGNGGDSLHGFAGLGAAYEDWDGSALEDQGQMRFPWRDEKNSEKELNAALRLRYSRAIFKTGAFDSDIAVYPSATDIGDFRARSETSLVFPLTERLKLRLNLRLDYDNDPGLTGLDEWGTSVGAGFRWDF